ncbi:DUF1611 domain-containing protein [Sphingomonas sp. LaA6.9]|uniref:DUF1611 domain-containing protein n=1 Tax=Sphingomonas sp. LaA6.9 TaxID=2919914 RepID=UPI001F5030A4|nr:DUF1611 domain-containing protein [Sphingomonas sp. LaA6.9]MCJ8159619.1 DUF1611 domain-containing protein [Sphingomonas sp. LaA6.9]
MNAHFDPTYGSALRLPQPYLLFLADTVDAGFAKTAFGLRDWAGDKCVGEFAIGATVSTGLPVMTPAEARAAGARALVIGVANSGGVIGDSWIASLVEALEAGLDIVSGMHARLSEIPELVEAAARLGRRLIDVRVPPSGLRVGTGAKRSGKRLLTVGTDCALGKKYTALALANAFAARGVDVDFRATGQTGIMIAGGGMPMDAVVSDFEAGAAEMLSPDADPGHWDVIEGQGSLFHPAYAAVSLGLLHGSQPDVIVVCHEPGRQVMLGTTFAAPSVEDTIALNLELGRRTNPAIRCGGVALNTSQLDADEAARVIAAESERLGLHVADPIRGGAAFDALVEACLK